MIKFIKVQFLNLYKFFMQTSWFLNVIGVFLTTVGGVVANVTAEDMFVKHCSSNKFCVNGLMQFMVFTVEGSMIIVGIVFATLGTFVGYRDKNLIEHLQFTIADKQQTIGDLHKFNSENSKNIERLTIDTFKLLNLILKDYYEEFDLGIEDRISLYVVKQEYFLLTGRYSENNIYRSSGRKCLEKNQGILGLAFERSWYEIDFNFRFEDNESRKNRYINKQCKKFRLPAELVQSFKMKSCCYKGLAIRGRGIGDPVAMICIESTKSGNLKHISREVAESRFVKLGVLLEALEPHMPSMDNAMSRGL